MPSILARHRIAALVGVALIATPLVASAMITNSAATPVMTTTTNGMTSFAPIVAADKPAVVTITTKMKAANVEYDGNSPFSGNSPFDEQFRQFFGQRYLEGLRQLLHERLRLPDALQRASTCDCDNSADPLRNRFLGHDPAEPDLAGIRQMRAAA